MSILELKKKTNQKKYIISNYPKILKDLINNRKKIPYKSINLKSAYLIDIVHNLIRRHYLNEEFFFNLSSIILKEKYGQHYNKYLEYLSDNNILKLQSNYYVGLKCKTYELPKYLLNDIDCKYKNEDTILVKKYNKKRSIEYLKKINYNHIDTDVMKKLVDNLDNIEIQTGLSFQYIDDSNMRSTQRNKNIHSVECLDNRDLWHKFDDFGRFHSNLTTLKSGIRSEYVLIDGEKTKEIDITNSQPIFLTLLIKNNIDRVDRSEYELLKRLVTIGQLYRYVWEETDLKTKKEVKRMIYRVLFGTNHLGNKENKVFNKLFPSIFTYIKQYKKEKGDYRALAYELQRSESNFLYNDVIRDILSEKPELSFFTVHDSITVKESDYDFVYKIFEDHIKLLHGELDL